MRWQNNLVRTSVGCTFYSENILLHGTSENRRCLRDHVAHRQVSYSVHFVEREKPAAKVSSQTLSQKKDERFSSGTLEISSILNSAKHPKNTNVG